MASQEAASRRQRTSGPQHVRHLYHHPDHQRRSADPLPRCFRRAAREAGDYTLKSRYRCPWNRSDSMKPVIGVTPDFNAGDRQEWGGKEPTYFFFGPGMSAPLKNSAGCR